MTGSFGAYHKRTVSASDLGTVHSFFRLPSVAPSQTLFILDESGDLGWNFSQPYRKGGSSRFLTVSALVVPSDQKQFPKRIIKAMHSKYKWSPQLEVKASSFSLSQSIFFATELQKAVQAHPEILIMALTVKKQNVEPHIRDDGNKLYNWMTKLLIGDQIASQQAAVIMPDERSIKVKSGNSLLDYLAIDQWFERKTKVRLTFSPQQSATSLNVRVADAIAHIVFAHYEDGRDDGFSILKGSGRVDQTLFF